MISGIFIIISFVTVPVASILHGEFGLIMYMLQYYYLLLLVIILCYHHI